MLYVNACSGKLGFFFAYRGFQQREHLLAGGSHGGCAVTMLLAQKSRHLYEPERSRYDHPSLLRYILALDRGH